MSLTFLFALMILGYGISYCLKLLEEPYTGQTFYPVEDVPGHFVYATRYVRAHILIDTDVSGVVGSALGGDGGGACGGGGGGCCGGG